jgi:hypothetical protein
MHMLKPALIIAAAGAAFASIPAASASPGTRWPTVATTTLDRSGTDNIYFPGRQSYRAIKLCVARAPLRLRNVRIYYRNGGKHDAAGRQWLNPGSCTLRMDLRGRGRDRDITRVRLNYDPFGRDGRNPVVRISAH